MAAHNNPPTYLLGVISQVYLRYIKLIHLIGSKMDQLLQYVSDGHVPHTKLLRLDAPFVTPCVTFDSRRNHIAEFEAKLGETRYWGEGEDVTLCSRPSPWSSVQRRQDNGRRHPSLHTTSGEDLQRGHPTVRPRPAWRPTGDPALCRGPCVATACYGPNL
jgi:hypothetical protein